MIPNICFGYTKLTKQYGDGSKPWYLVNPKIAGKWMFIPLKMVCIGIDPYPYHLIIYSLYHPIQNLVFGDERHRTAGQGQDWPTLAAAISKVESDEGDMDGHGTYETTCLEVPTGNLT